MGKIPRKVWVLGLTSFFTDVSTESIMSVFPVYLYYFLGLGAYGLGIVEGLAEFISSVLKGLSGPLVDRFWGRKKGALLGYGLSTAFKSLFLLSTYLPGAAALKAVIAARLGDRLGKGIRTSPRDAMLASVEGEKGRIFGIHRAMDQAGAVVGPLLAIPFLYAFGFRGVFAFALIPSVIAVLILGLGIPEEPRYGRRVPILQTFRAANWRYVLGISVLSAGVFSIAFPLIAVFGESARLLVDVRGRLTVVMLFFVLQNVLYTASSYPFGRMLDALGPRNSLIVTAAFLLCMDLLVASLGLGMFQVALFVSLYGVFMAFFEVGRRAATALITEHGAYGQGMGIMHLSSGLSLLAGNTVFGYLWSRAPWMALAFSASMAALSIPIFALSVRK